MTTRVDGVLRGVTLIITILITDCHTIPQAPEPIAECVDYEHELARCTGRHEPIANQAAAMPSAEADRERVRELCTLNLARIHSTCR